MDDEVILICGSPEYVTEPLPGTVKETCADYGKTVLRMPDPDVPKEAIVLCLPCGIARMEASNEVPEFHMTKQNEELLRKRGWKLKPAEGSC